MLVLVIGSNCHRATQGTPITTFLGALAFGDYGICWYDLLPVVCFLAAV